MAINKHLYRKINYDPQTSFAPIIRVGYLPNVLVVNPATKATTVQELIAQDKAKPGSLDYASSGNGASSHLAGVLFNKMAGTSLQHIPYKGTGPALNDLLAGQGEHDLHRHPHRHALHQGRQVQGHWRGHGKSAPRPCPTSPPSPSRACPATT